MDGTLKEVTAVYDEDAVGSVVTQYLNDTTVGLATFTPFMMSLSSEHFYHISNPPYTEVIQATLAIPIYITSVEIGSSQKQLGVLPSCCFV